MTEPISLFDVLLAASLLVLAWGALRSADLFKGIVLFVVFGLLMAVAWIRLRAPDIALAEAAIGSGVTGALLLAALARLERDRPAVRVGRPILGGHLQPGAGAMAAVLCWSVLELPAEAPGLAAAVESQLPQTGVTNPVAAVILNYRGYDTLLELGVLLIALIGAAVLARPADPEGFTQGTESDPVLRFFLRSMAPVFVLVAGYLVWVGGHEPGGAFQAGALLAGAGVVALLAGCTPPSLGDRRLVRAVLAAGVLAFLAVGIGTAGAGAFLQYTPAWAKHLLLFIEVASTAAIGLTLALLFAFCAYGHVGTSDRCGDGP